jgi:hypothetical protein
LIFSIVNQSANYVDQLETFDLNEHHYEIFDYDDVHDLNGRILVKDSRPLIG